MDNKDFQQYLEEKEGEERRKYKGDLSIWYLGLVLLSSFSQSFTP